MFDNLTDENFLIYAVKHYNSPMCMMSEFESDIKRIKYLKRLFRRYKITKSVKEKPPPFPSLRREQSFSLRLTMTVRTLHASPHED